MLNKILVVLVLLLLALAAYLAFAPVPIEPVAWKPPMDRGYSGPFAVNRRMTDLQLIAIGGERGPEHVAVGPDGKLYAAVEGGKILRMNLDGSGLELWAQTGGRVLGFDFAPDGHLIGADAERGLIVVDPAGEQAGVRKITVLADKVEVDGRSDPIRFADAVVVSKSGLIYFTDASRRFAPSAWGGTFEASLFDLMEHAATGRVLVYDPFTAGTQVMASGLSFANGLALAADESALFVAETGEYRIWKIAVGTRNLDIRRIAANDSVGPARVLIDNLPGYPDNLMRGLEGRIWAGLVKPRSSANDQMADKPFLRKMAMRLPRSLWPIPPAYGHVFAFDESGNITADLQDPDGRYPETTGVTETADRLYFQSLHAKDLGWLSKKAAGL